MLLRVRRSIVYLSLLFSCIAGVGCFKLSPLPPVSPSQAQEKLIKICQEDYGLEVHPTAFPHTLWIYLPLKESFFSIEPSEEEIENSRESKEVPTINFLDGHFSDGTFLIEFDISSSRRYKKSFGYTSTFSERYQVIQQNILAALSRAYAEVIKNPDKKTDAAPMFFIVIIADIENGLESRMLLNFQDLLRVMTDHSFQEEFIRRAIIEYPTGSKKIIGDRKGDYLDYHEMTWPEFLVKQMLYRVKFKYERSAFPPTQEAKEEILDIAAQTVKIYSFADFQSLRLHDLSTDSLYTIEKSELEKRSIPQEPEGRYHILEFR
ncbi:MAG TPA: hypothetical protein DD723_05585 [Candidatus Omnitrophica bacterium]|nr:MAG: hypothetical protein A2Z81_05465 [Omnitrophica WOR_2 bacterium GWA2_45_18]HBR14998.1 hypothetical protein [Candidatus Omnitrophota bacterium]